MILSSERWRAIRSDEGLTLESSASESLYSGQITLPQVTPLITPNNNSNKKIILGHLSRQLAQSRVTPLIHNGNLVEPRLAYKLSSGIFSRGREKSSAFASVDEVLEC